MATRTTGLLLYRNTLVTDPRAQCPGEKILIAARRAARKQLSSQSKQQATRENSAQEVCAILRCGCTVLCYLFTSDILVQHPSTGKALLVCPPNHLSCQLSQVWLQTPLEALVVCEFKDTRQYIQCRHCFAQSMMCYSSWLTQLDYVCFALVLCFDSLVLCSDCDRLLLPSVPGRALLLLISSHCLLGPLCPLPTFFIHQITGPGLGAYLHQPTSEPPLRWTLVFQYRRSPKKPFRSHRCRWPAIDPFKCDVPF